MAASVPVNVMLPQDAVDFIDEKRAWTPRSRYLVGIIAEWVQFCGPWSLATEVPASCPVMVSIYPDAALVAVIDKERGGEPRSSYLRRLILSGLEALDGYLLNPNRNL